MEAGGEQKESKPIDKVSIDILDVALRMCNIQIHKTILDKIIDIVELLEDKGGDATVEDMIDLQKTWRT